MCNIPVVPERVDISNPSVGVNFTHTVPANTAYKLLAIIYRIVTDANAANRGMRILITDGTKNRMILVPSNNVTASLTVDIAVAPGLQSTLLANRLVHPMPDNLILRAASVISSAVSLIQVGDQLSLIELWVEKYADTVFRDMV